VLLRQLAVKAPSLTSADVQQLLLHLLADAPRPHWLSVHGRPCTVVIVELPGLDHQLLLERPPPLPRLLAGARQRVMLRATAAHETASQTTAALLAVAPPRGRGSHKRKQPEPSAGMVCDAGRRPEATHQSQEATPAERAFPPAFYAVTSRTMRALSWPQGCAEAAAAAEAEVELNTGWSGGPAAAGKGVAAAAAAQAVLQPGWVSTAQRSALLAGSESEGVQAGATRAAAGEAADRSLPAPEELVACDCEMGITAAGLELARVSLVAGDGRRLLDQLVVPDEPVLDYNTKYSGGEGQGSALQSVPRCQARV
jgi:RNA exonuclease 1